MTLSNTPGAIKRRNWRSKNIAKDLERERKWRAKNRSKSNAYALAWRLRNPARAVIVRSRADAKRDGRSYSPITDSEERVQWWLDNKPKICQVPRCGKREGSRSLHLDHDHVTGKIRGWICAKCNHILGYIELGWVAKVQAWKDSLPK